MDSVISIISIFVLCYLLGSIPAAVWTGKLFYGIDVRTMGSGNAGSTNVFRVLGRPAGLFVLLFDISKGYLATSLAHYLHHVGSVSDENLLFFKMLLGLTAVFGHIYPVFAGFKGGKGVATFLGMVFALSPLVALICLAVFLFFFLSFHYVSVGSMIAGVIFSVLIFSGLAGDTNIQTKGMALMMTLMLFYTHRTNIQKLRLGTENKMYLFKKKTT